MGSKKVNRRESGQRIILEWSLDLTPSGDGGAGNMGPTETRKESGPRRTL